MKQFGRGKMFFLFLLKQLFVEGVHCDTTIGLLGPPAKGRKLEGNSAGELFCALTCPLWLYQPLCDSGTVWSVPNPGHRYGEFQAVMRGSQSCFSVWAVWKSDLKYRGTTTILIVQFANQVRGRGVALVDMM